MPAPAASGPRPAQRRRGIAWAGHAVTDPAEAPDVDCMFLGVKAHQTPGAATWLRALDHGVPLVMLQNGVRLPSRVNGLWAGPVMPAVVYCPSLSSVSAVSQPSDRSTAVGRPMTVSQSVVIAVAPEVVFAAISDPTQTGRWSPENLGARMDGAVGVGTTFVGRNKRGWKRWITRCQVTEYEPGTRFAFEVNAIGLIRPWIKTGIATWSYDLTPAEGGTQVVETWIDGRTWSDRQAAIFDRWANGSTFAEYNTGNIRRTLDKLKQTLESPA